MTFQEVLAQVMAWLQREQRVSYRAIKRQFALDDDYLEDLKDELIHAKQLAMDEAGRVLVWIGTPGTPQVPATPLPQPAPLSATQEAHPPQTPGESLGAERRQLTVLFCDLVDSTRLAGQLDPEDYHRVVRAYQETCVAIIQRFDGYIAQYLGDGLLVYFGYPVAHEDDARRAVHTGLAMLEAMRALNSQLERDRQMRCAVRVGIHTGLVVGAVGEGARQEHLALGEVPNLAARLQSLAAPDMVVMSVATWRLVQGYFAYDDLGLHALKGVAAPVRVYRVQGESGVQSRLEVAAASGLTPLVGRTSEVTLLLEPWAQSTEGLGQVVLLSGEAGIGKSRLVETLHARVEHEHCPCITLRCSPYHTNSALYPVLEHIQRLLHFHPDDTPQARLARLEQMLAPYRLPLEETAPLLAAWLSLPLPEAYPPLHLSPQQQWQKTQAALVAWLLGYPDQARQWSEAALLHAQGLGHAFTLAQALLLLALLHLLRREAAVAQERAEATRALSTEQGFALYLPWGTIEWGAALAAQGAWVEGLAQMRQGLAAYQAMGRLPQLLFLGLLAEACGRAGQVEAGLRALHEALEVMQTSEERLYEAEVYRLRGDLLQQSAAPQGEAEESFHQSLTVARRQQAKSWELRAAMSLARLR